MTEGNCPVCGHPMDDHGENSVGDKLVCPGTCAECGRSLELVAEGAAEGCTVCTGFLDMLGASPSPAAADDGSAMDALQRAKEAFESAYGIQQLPEVPE